MSGKIDYHKFVITLTSEKINITSETDDFLTIKKLNTHSL
jgi:hypothetical protein